MHDARPAHAVDGRQQGKRASSAFTSVPSGVPRAGCVAMPAGLSTTQKSSSSYTSAIGRACGSSARSRGGGAVTRIFPRPSTRCDGFTTRPSSVTCPSRMRARAGAARALEESGEDDVKAPAPVRRTCHEAPTGWSRCTHVSTGSSVNASDRVALAGPAGARFSWTSICKSKIATPIVMAESATLKTGHHRRSMKSWT